MKPNVLISNFKCCNLSDPLLLCNNYTSHVFMVVDRYVYRSIVGMGLSYCMVPPVEARLSGVILAENDFYMIMMLEGLIGDRGK